MTTPIRSVSEVAMWVTDLDRAVGFYRDRLGFAVQEIDAGRNAFLKAGDFLLVLFVRASPGTPLAEEYLGKTGGAARGEVYHVAFAVDPDELDDYCDRLRATGLAVKGPVDFASGRRSYFVEDPDEHYIELSDR